MTTVGSPTWAHLSPSEIEDLTRTRSPKMERVLASIAAVAPTRTTVLFTGETGTGKGLLSRLLHHLSHRSAMPFAAVHCGAIPETLLESELFGHEKGAFTGAVRRKLGKFEVARAGTLFLDEIGTMSAAAQVRLLQVLQDRVFQRVGGEEDIETDVRLLVATNDDLERLVDEGRFRRDLYYRINVFAIEIPPLRERPEDIPSLVRHILKKLNRLHGKELRDIHPDVLEALQSYHWPGNIRELENLVERAHILEKTNILTPESFPAELIGEANPVAAVPVDASKTLAAVRREAVKNVERRYLAELLTACEGRIGFAAGVAGITPRQLHKLLTRHGLRKEEFRLPRPARIGTPGSGEGVSRTRGSGGMAKPQG